MIWDSAPLVSKFSAMIRSTRLMPRSMRLQKRLSPSKYRSCQ